MYQLNLFSEKLAPLAKPCPCGSQTGFIYPTEKSHSGLIRCSSCDRFLKWLSVKDFERAKKSNLVNDK